MTDFCETEMAAFAAAVANFFTRVTHEKPVICASYQDSPSSQAPLLEYVGLIRLSGEYTGQILFSCSKAGIKKILAAMSDLPANHPMCPGPSTLPEITSGLPPQSSPEQESGYLGSTMEISCPEHFEGSVSAAPPLVLEGQHHPYVIDLSWETFKACLILDIHRTGVGPLEGADPRP